VPGGKSCPGCDLHLLVQRSDDGGGTWTEPRPIAPIFVKGGQYDSQIVVDPVDGRTVWASFLQNANSLIAVVKSTDFGQTWKPIATGLPKHPLGYARVIAEDPNSKGLLFVGTGNSLYYSLDDGGHWSSLQTGLPHVPVSWLVVQKQFHDLVVSTYGRGFYILDDITPLEQMAKENTETSVRLFTPRASYRFMRGGRISLTYALKSATHASWMRHASGEPTRGRSRICERSKPK
jgi:hypothetical protein